MRDDAAHPVSLPLRAGVHAARSGDGMVFLDMTTDVYVCLYDPLTCAPERSADEWSTLLAEGGLGGGDAAIPVGRPRPWRNLPSADEAPLRMGDLAGFLLAVRRAGRIFHMRSFARLVDGPLPGARTFGPIDESAYAAAVSRFDRLSLWLPWRMQCLFRSLALLIYLRSCGLRADWVFGASLFPFQAHCWLATGNLLLGERASRVDRLAILRVRENAGS